MSSLLKILSFYPNFDVFSQIFNFNYSTDF